MKLNTSQIGGGETRLIFSSPSDSWLNKLLDRFSERGYQVHAPLIVNMLLTKVEPDFFLKGDLTCKVEQECSRCAEKFDLDIKHRFEIIFSEVNGRKTRQDRENKLTPSDAQGIREFDINFFEGHEIELSPVIEEQFYLAIPFQSFCRENCLGICQRCGVNRNVTECGCSVSDRIGPFSVLGGLNV